MGGERVSDSSPTEGSGSDSSTPFFNTYTKIFYEQLPYYLAIGMTYNQFFYESPDLVIHFRKAEQLKNEKMNEQMWWQGLYIYDAIARLTPLMHAFAKEGTKAVPYMDRPYPLTDIKAKEIKVEREEAEFKAKMAKFEANTIAVNMKFKDKSEVNPDGDRNRSTANRDNG